jgi:hypothetical protein
MVNGKACPKMRQYDRARDIGKRVRECHIGLEIGLFGLGHGSGLAAFALRSQGFMGDRRGRAAKFQDFPAGT